MLDNDKRRQLIQLRKQIAALTSDDKKARAQARKKAQQERRQAMSRAPGQRAPRVHDAAYLNYIRRQPCCACGKAAPSQAAHIRSGYPEAGWRSTGMAEKPDDRRTLPLCRDCHLDGPKAQHRTNERAWWQKLDIYPPALCDEYIASYEAGDAAEDSP